MTENFFGLWFINFGRTDWKTQLFRRQSALSFLVDAFRLEKVDIFGSIRDNFEFC